MSDIATVTMSLPAVVGMAVTIAASALGVAGWIVSRIEAVRTEIRAVDRRVYRIELSLDQMSAAE